MPVEEKMDLIRIPLSYGGFVAHELKLEAETVMDCIAVARH